MLSLSSTHLDREEINQVFKKQKATALAWRKSSHAERSDRLKKLRTWILNHKADIRTAVAADFKKPVAEVDLSEIFPVTSEIKHTLAHLKSWMKGKSVSTPLPMLGTQGRVIPEAKGVSLIIAPWNYPFNLAIGPLVSALAAGCTAIIKPSEMTPHTSKLIEKLIQEVFKEDEVAVFQGDASVSQALLELPFDHIFFTGSPQVGKIVMKAAAEHLTSVTLELGGKSPAIIQKGASLKDAAGKLVVGKYLNCGQTCVAPDYILVHQEDRDTLLDEMKVFIQKAYDPDFKGIEATPDYARIVNDKHYERLISLMTDAQDKGAILAFGGNYDPHTRYIEPCILNDVTMDMKVMEEEIFGPILPIMTYENLDEAIALVNSLPKPLALYFFGEDGAAKNQVLSETSSGNAVINDCVLHFLHNDLPFGGVNNSGIGKAHGYYGFLAFSNEKGILTQRVGTTSSTLLNPPYGTRTKQILSTLIKWF
ncbi:aldehyde dehydrogenase family protein [Algoriphagus namhaensis]|uniref:Aldehyde dehydrogenase n=1 Tax=Algoriphagus namhaensis TaxID=915353 RepID=A0ABV8ATJ0_9BACT